MEIYTMVKLKRKDLEDFSDDFSDFSLSSPARKIRRMDAELSPIVEEDEPEMYIEFEQSPDEIPSLAYKSSRILKIEEVSSQPLNEERAVVLFKPKNAASNYFLRPSPSDYSISFTPQILSRFKNQVMLSRESNFGASDNVSRFNSQTLYVIPQPSFSPVVSPPQLELDNPDMMMMIDNSFHQL